MTRKVFLILLALVLALSVSLVACTCTQPAEEEEEEETYTLIIATTGGGSTTPGEGMHTYDAGEVVDLVAEPDVCYRFVNWTGDVGTIADVNAATASIIMDRDYTITASFAAPETVTYDIDYSNPELYLKSGNQSTLNEKYSSEINTQLSIENLDMEALAEIFMWKNGYFTLVPGGGPVGRSTINQLMEVKELTGCHDHALVFASICRHFGFPAIMVDTAGIQWAYDYLEGRSGGWLIGHVFVEVYVNNNWILIDSTGGEYVEDYDPCNPVIPMTNPMESKGHFVLLKGLDPEEYGITSQGDFLGEKMIEFALNVESIDMQFPEYTIKNLFDLLP